MARRNIGNPIDDGTLNDFNHNFIELYDGVRGVKREIDNLVLNSDGESNLEVVQARTDGKGKIHSTLKRRIDENIKEVTSQLVDKADKEYVDDLIDGKADKSALTQVATIKRDKDVEIEMKDLSQDVKEAMTGGSVAVVGEDAVSSVNIKDNAVTSSKLDKNAMTRTPWLNTAEHDLDYVWIEGNYRANSNAKNNPYNSGIFLKVERSRTTDNASNILIKQSVVRAQSTFDTAYSYRVLQVDESAGVITYKKEWKEILSGKVKREDLDRLYNVSLPWLNSADDNLNYVWETGSYMISENVKNNPTNNVAILEVTEAKTQSTGDLSWVRQVVTLAHTSLKSITYSRVMQVNNANAEPNWVKEWEIVGGDSSNYIGVKWVALGTSITSRGEYTDYVASQLGLDLDNRGRGSGGITNYAGNGNPGNTTMQRVMIIEDFKGIVSIELGPNDWVFCPLGELGDTEDNTWYGAVDTVCRTITKRTSARPFFITSATTAFNSGANFDESQRRSVYHQNSQGHKYIEYVNAVKEVAQHYSIPVVDVFGESGLGSYHQNEETLVDHIHLSDTGGAIMGEHIVKFLQNQFTTFPNDYVNALVNQ